MDPTEVLTEICDLLQDGRTPAAREVARRHLPFAPVGKKARAYSEADALRVFVADGFRCRYFGERLVFPGALRLIGELMPGELPYHPHGKMEECHLVHWTLYPTVDHVTPVSRGGEDEPANRVCTSMLRNAVKGHWTLEELGWSLLPRSASEEWDGLFDWYLRFVEVHPEVLESSFHKRWYKAAAQVRRGGKELDRP